MDTKTRGAFYAFLKQKYSYKSNANTPTNCTFGVESAVRAAKDRFQAQYKQANKQIVETGWKYTPQ
jgi:hypothetical protein